jgi:hypothetical protein
MKTRQLLLASLLACSSEKPHTYGEPSELAGRVQSIVHTWPDTSREAGACRISILRGTEFDRFTFTGFHSQDMCDRYNVGDSVRYLRAPITNFVDPDSALRKYQGERLARDTIYALDKVHK